MVRNAAYLRDLPDTLEELRERVRKFAPDAVKALEEEHEQEKATRGGT